MPSDGRDVVVAPFGEYGVGRDDGIEVRIHAGVFFPALACTSCSDGPSSGASWTRHPMNWNTSHGVHGHSMAYAATGDGR